MTKLDRIELETLGELGECGIAELEGMAGTGEELKAFLDPYVAAHPDSEGWPQWRGRQINHVLFPILRRQTQDHCSFCDGYPMKDAMTAETIEHFRPKKGRHARPDLRLTWDNLFACCSGCQTAKGDKWDDRLLKPDAVDYEFKRYFSCQFTTGKIVPKHRANAEDRDRAKTTIDLYDLNRSAVHRADMFEKHPWYGENVPDDKKSFRYWHEPVARAKARLPPVAQNSDQI